MAPKGISSLIDADANDSSHVLNEDTIESIERDEGSPEPPKKKGGRPKGAKNGVTKVKAAPKRQRAASNNAPKKKAVVKAGARKNPAGKQADLQNDVDDGEERVTTTRDTDGPSAAEEESDDELDSPKTISQGALSGKTSQESKKRSAQSKRKFANMDDAMDTIPQEAVSEAVPSRGGKPKSAGAEPPANKRAKKQNSVPERQQRALAGDEHGGNAVNQHQAPSSYARVTERPRDGSRSRQEPQFWRRPGSASDTERTAGDPNLRRKLGDITKKFENVDMKYRNLKEVGITEANANVEKLRLQCEATTKASNDLITALKKELATQSSIAQESRKYQKTLSTRETEVGSLRSNVAELTASLSTAQNEIRALQAKLAASRSSVEASHSKPPPGSAMKRQAPSKTPNLSSSEAAQVAQLKEDLYSDLTGLIIRGVKKTDEGDLYDCIQTGRNGIEDPDGQQTSFEETEFLYIPLLDDNRDRDLLEVLPEYLTEEITFSRQHASKFYSRVVDALTKQRVREEA
ncbi:MAG: hypothetical protein Q9227_008773 [Pyrenula ochraceoflavens]